MFYQCIVGMYSSSVLMLFLVCVMRMPSGVTTLEIQPPSRQNEASFDAHFSGEEGNYLNYTAMPTLASFTLCLWMKQKPTISGFFAQTIMSYSNSNHKQAFKISSFGGGITNGATFYYMGIYIGFPEYNNQDKHWHHVCFSWNNQRSEMISHVDGTLARTIPTLSVPKGAVLQGGGCLVVGWSQNSHCGRPTESISEKAYTGQLSQMNIWRRLLTDMEVSDLYRSCDVKQGDAFSWNWKKLDSSFTGTNVTSPSSACQHNYASAIFMKYHNHMLATHAIIRLQVPDEMSCASACLRQFGCRSFNLVQESGAYICELNNAEKSQDPSNFMEMSGVVYYPMSENWNG